MLELDQHEELLKSKVLFGNEAKEQILQGMKIVSDAVSSTLGPLGKCVIIERANGKPYLTKDGVSVAKAIRLKNKIHSLGAELIKEAASQTNDSTGDGTTTCTLLTYEMCSEGNRLSAAGHSLIEIRDGISEAVQKVLNELDKISSPIRNKGDILRIATISANGDNEIGTLVSNAVDQVGQEGIITVEEAKSTQTSLEITNGMKIDRGYISPYFITNTEKMIAALEDAYVFVSDATFAGLQEFLPLLEGVSRTGKPLLLIAGEVENQALQALVVNKLKGALSVCAITAPAYDFGAQRTEFLLDICALTGAKFISKEEVSDALKKFSMSMLGKCKKAIVAKNSTVLVVDEQNPEVEQRAETIRKQLSNPSLGEDEYKILKSRLAKLVGAAAVIRVGGATEMEITEKKDRVEDALNATRVAIEEGIVAGGGSALLRAAEALSGNSVGANIIKRACQSPIRKIAENSGRSGSVVVAALLDKERCFGYDATNDKYEDMFKLGILDPLKVVKTALLNAASVAKSFLSLSTAIVVEDDR